MTRSTVYFAVGLSLLARAAAAQSAPPASVVKPNSFYIGVGHASESGRSQAPFVEWLGSSGLTLGGARAVTDHLSVEATVGIWKDAGDRGAELFSTTPSGPITSTLTIDAWKLEHQTLSIAANYQFLPNTWVQPFVAAGVEVSRDHWMGQRETQLRARQMNGNVGIDVLVSDTFAPLPDSVRVEARPFGAAGLKAYVARRVFLRGELHVGSRVNFESVTWQLTAGFDF